MYRDMQIAVVVPAYNEEGFVGDVIDGLPEFVDRAYVVDDGSTDSTWAEITHHATARNESHDGVFEDLVVPIRHESNRGVGGAIKTGYLRARSEDIDAAVVLGGDDQMDPHELTGYLDPIADGTAEYTKGNRFSRPEDWADMPRFRFIGNVALSFLTKIASGYWELMDSQNGYTAISASALDKADIEGMYEYYGYCNDLLVRLNAADVRVADVPRGSGYAYSDGWKSHIDYTEYIPRVSAMLLQSFFWRLRRKYIVTDYRPLAPLYIIGMILSSLGLLGLLTSVFVRSREGPAAWLLTTAIGVLTFFRATELDRAENLDLSVRLTQESGPSRSGDTEGSDPGTERQDATDLNDSEVVPVSQS